MSKLLIHPNTQGALDEYAKNPGHALVICGPNGLGKGSLAQRAALELLGSAHASAVDEPGILYISPEKGTIGIEAVRDLQHFMSLKSVSSKPITRVAIVEDAQQLSGEAQNALLKLLEEPPMDSVIILTATSEHALLPTIRSRVRQIAAIKPDVAKLQRHFEQAGHDSAAVTKAINMSGGLPGLMTALLADDQAHPLQLAAQQARQVLSANLFERQCLVDSLAKERQLAIDTCAMLGQMASLALRNPKILPEQVKKWQKILTGSLKAGEDLGRYVQPKLVLSRYLLSF